MPGYSSVAQTFWDAPFKIALSFGASSKNRHSMLIVDFAFEVVLLGGSVTELVAPLIYEKMRCRAGHPQNFRFCLPKKVEKFRSLCVKQPVSNEQKDGTPKKPESSLKVQDLKTYGAAAMTPLSNTSCFFLSVYAGASRLREN